MRILGIGTAVPRHSIGQSEVAEINKLFCPAEADRLHLIPALYRKGGVRKRHSVLLETAEGAPLERQSFFGAAADATDRGPTTRARMQAYENQAAGLVVDAAGAALADAGIEPQQCTHLVTVSCTGFHAPGPDIAIIDRLGMSPAVQRTHVGFMGCHGALNGLRVAASFCAADPDACVLVAAVELCTLHFFYGWDAEKIVANSLFADGAGALVGAPGNPSSTDWRVAASGSYLMPESGDAMTWTVGDHGFEMTLSAQVPKLIRDNLPAWLEGWLAAHDLRLDDIATWAVHPGGPRILTAFETATSLEPKALTVSRDVLAEFGNMSSATLLFILQRLRQNHAPRPCVAVGFGPGMAVETVLLR